MSSTAQVNKETGKVGKMGSALSRAIGDLLRGNFLTRSYILRNLKFIIFCFSLGIFYISYGYYAERNIKSMYQLQKELKEAKAENLSLRSELEQLKQQSSVARRIKSLGLVESTDPPRIIKVDAEKE